MKRSFLLLITSVLVFGNIGTVSAEATYSGLPENEITAVRDYARWVASVCGPDQTTAPSNASGIPAGPIYIMGDSITNIAKDAYQKKFASPWEPTVEGYDGRQIDGGSNDGISQINKTEDKKAIAKANAIVIALGTNGIENDAATTKRQVSRFMTELNKLNTGSAPVFWVNTYDHNNLAESRITNRAIDDGMGNDVTTINWYGEAKTSADGASFGEGVHPTAQKDIDLLVNKVYTSVVEDAPTNSGPTSLSSSSSGAIINSSKTPKNGQSLGGVAGTGFTKAEVDKAKARGHGSFEGGENFLATTYGPPWDSVEGTGITSTGLRLDGPNNSHGRPRYVIAVDPNVIPYGSLVTVWPNAVGWRGAFLAADTGGAIDGKHVDVYDWSGDATKDVFSSPKAKIMPYTGSLAETGDAPAAATDTSSAAKCCPTDGLNASPGSGAPDGTTFPNLDPTAMANAIDKYIVKINPNSTLKGLGKTIVATAKNADINPFLIVTIAQKESTLGDPSVFNVSRGNNAFGRTAAPGQPSFQGSRAWYKWSSVKASVDYTAAENKAAGGSGGDMGGFIKDVYADSIKNGDFVAFFMKYAPPGENDTATYVAQVKDWMKDLVELTGQSGGDSATTSASSTPDTNACCPPQGSETTSPATTTGKPDFIDMSGAPVNGTSMGHGKLNNIKTLIIHYVQGDAEGAALKRGFTSGGQGYGIQFNIGATGKVYQYFPLNDMQITYHAKGVGVNSHAIGIEITGADGEELMNNSKQFATVVQTAKYLCDYYDIPCSNPKGDITNSSSQEAQGMIGHSETPSNDHHDPDTKVTYPNGRGGPEAATNIATGRPWKESDRKDSSKHAYMMKLRKAMGFNETPGTANQPSNNAGGSDASTQESCPAPPSNAESSDMKKTIKVTTPGKFITLPSKYSCSGRRTVIDSRIAANIAYLVNKYNMCAADGLANGHKSHGAGLAVDMSPKSGNSKEAWKSTVEAAARDMGWYGDSATDPKGSKDGCANYAPGAYGQCMWAAHQDKFPRWLRWIGYNGDYQHGDPWHVYGGNFAHIHIGWDTPNDDGVAPGIISTPRESVYTFPAPVPDDLKSQVN